MEKLVVLEPGSFSHIALMQAMDRLRTNGQFTKAKLVKAGVNEEVLPKFLEIKEGCVAVSAMHTLAQGRIDESFRPFFKLLDSRKDPTWRIAGGFRMPIKFALMVRKGVHRTKIQGILGDEEALAGCAGKIAKLTKWTQETKSSTEAVRAVARNGLFKSDGAIGPITCADEWGLHVLDRDFSDKPASRMFCVLATEDVVLRELQPLISRILVVFEVKNAAGALVSVLKKVEKWSILHLTRSHKTGKCYRFGMELEVPGKEVSKAVDALRSAPARVIALPFPIVPISGCP